MQAVLIPMTTSNFLGDVYLFQILAMTRSGYYGSIKPSEFPNFIESDPVLCTICRNCLVIPSKALSYRSRPIYSDRILNNLTQENVHELCNNFIVIWFCFWSRINMMW